MIWSMWCPTPLRPVLSFGDTLYVNFIRNVKDAALESHFCRVLQDMGLAVEVESNNPER